MFKIEIDPTSLGIIQRSSERYKKRFRAASNKALIDISDYLKKAVTKNISRKDFTLKELAELDNPYARRHGRILTGKLGMPFNNSQEYLIHTRKGGLRKDLKVKKNKSDGTAVIYFNDTSGHTRYVIEGTRVLLPRDVISGTLRLKTVNDKMFSIAKKHFKDVIKSYGE